MLITFIEKRLYNLNKLDIIRIRARIKYVLLINFTGAVRFPTSSETNEYIYVLNFQILMFIRRGRFWARKIKKVLFDNCFCHLTNMF